MGRRKGWSLSEEQKLKENYSGKTIKELEKIFPERSRESINNKIKRLKAKKKITTGKSKIAIQRAYVQRRKSI